LHIREPARERRRAVVMSSRAICSVRSGPALDEVDGRTEVPHPKPASNNGLAFFRFPGKLLQGTRCSTISTWAALHQNRAIDETIS
jgi:hypothetical protein